MAWRLNTSVVKGELDNRERGKVTGRIWLFGREDPVRLELEGNMWKDIAGCLVTFVNPSPARCDNVELAPVQKGAVGDMTASRKVRVPDVPFEEMMRLSKEGKESPEHIANCMYIEWYSESNGRVVIESVDFKIDLSPNSWRMTAEDEKQQRASNMQTFDGFLDRLAKVLDREKVYAESLEEEDDKPMDEFEWERFLKEADARTDRYGEILDKFRNDPERDKIAARKMGWARLEDEFEKDEDDKPSVESEDEDIWPDDEDFDLEPDPETEGIDWVRDERGYTQHPVAKRASDLSVRMWQECDKNGLLGENGHDDVHAMVFQTQMTSAKLAGALNSLCYDVPADGGFIVAYLKRALKYLHDAQRYMKKASDNNLVPAADLNSYQTELFEIREQILALMKRFRG